MSIGFRSDTDDPDPYNLEGYGGSKGIYQEHASLQLGIEPLPPAPNVTIGDDAASTTSAVPYNSLYGYSFVEQIYTAEEIGQQIGVSGGSVTSIGFKMSETEASQTTHITVYMKNVSRSDFADATDYEPVTPGEIVYEGNYTFHSGWNTITLDMPFD